MKQLLKKVLYRVFTIAQAMGVNILPKHFYSVVPDIKALKADDYWQARSVMAGVNMRSIEEQVAFISDCLDQEVGERAANAYHDAIEMVGEGGGYGPIEAQVLYGYIVRHQPKRIIQIGAGVTTAIIRQAAKEAGYSPSITAIDPYPSAYLQAQNDASNIKLIKDLAQKVNLETYRELSAGDFFFVDSTHTVKTGSEVNRIILDILPSLAAGVMVHFHDIYFPYDYPRDAIDGDMLFPLESTLLQAYLSDNPRYEIQCALSMLHYDVPQAIATSAFQYDPQQNHNGLRGTHGNHFPSAIYLNVIANPTA